MGRKRSYSIYMIKECNIIRYIGISNHPYRRRFEHLKRRGTSNSAIPCDVNLKDIEFIVVEKYYNREDALIREGELIKKYDTIKNGWNRYNSGVFKHQTSEKNKNDNVLPDIFEKWPFTGPLQNAIIRGKTVLNGKMVTLVVMDDGKKFYY